MSQKQQQQQQHQKKNKLFPFLCWAVSLESWNSERFNYPIVSPLRLATESPGNKAPRCLLRDLFLKVKPSEPNLSGGCKQAVAGRQTDWVGPHPFPALQIIPNPSGLGPKSPPKQA